MKTYPVLSAIEHGTTDKDHRRYLPGEPIDLDDSAAAPLLAVGAIGDAVEAPVVEPKDVEPPVVDTKAKK